MILEFILRFFEQYLIDLHRHLKILFLNFYLLPKRQLFIKKKILTKFKYYCII